MGSLTEDGLLNIPYDKYWDAPLTRREAQRAINKLAGNDGDLNAMCDTLAIIGNFLCDKLGVTREEIDAYVAQKKLEIVANKKAWEVEQAVTNANA